MKTRLNAVCKRDLFRFLSEREDFVGDPLNSVKYITVVFNNKYSKNILPASMRYYMNELGYREERIKRALNTPEDTTEYQTVLEVLLIVSKEIDILRTELGADSRVVEKVLNQLKIKKHNHEIMGSAR